MIFGWFDLFTFQKYLLLSDWVLFLLLPGVGIILVGICQPWSSILSLSGADYVLSSAAGRHVWQYGKNV